MRVAATPGSSSRGCRVTRTSAPAFRSKAEDASFGGGRPTRILGTSLLARSALVSGEPRIDVRARDSRLNGHRTVSATTGSSAPPPPQAPPVAELLFLFPIFCTAPEGCCHAGQLLSRQPRHSPCFSSAPAFRSKSRRCLLRRRPTGADLGYFAPRSVGFGQW